MSVTVTIVFSGLIALAMDEEIPRARQKQHVTTSPFAAYLLRGAHVPQLVIPMDDVKTYTDTAGCKPAESNGVLVWDLMDRRIVVSQDPGSVAQYSRAGRGKGIWNRHYRYKTPKEAITKNPEINPILIRADLSWVPEMNKVFPGSELKIDDAQIAAYMEGIRGFMAGLDVHDDYVWDWCDWSGGTCTGRSGGKNYDQSFAGAVAVGLELRAPEIFLLPRSSSTTCVHRIELDVASSPTVYVYNHAPPATTPHKSPEQGASAVWCVAEHFEHYSHVVEPSPTSDRRPFFERPGRCTPWRPSLPGAPESFCPPVIFTRP